MLAAQDAGTAQYFERDVVRGGDEGDFFDGLGESISRNQW